MTDIVRRRLTQSDLDLFMAAHERYAQGRPGGRRLSLKFSPGQLAGMVTEALGL